MIGGEDRNGDQDGDQRPRPCPPSSHGPPTDPPEACCSAVYSAQKSCLGSYCSVVEEQAGLLPA